MIEIVQFPCLTDNYGFLVHDQGSGKTAAIDTPDPDAILAAAKSRGWRIDEIWNTHWHPDHAGGNLALVTATGAVTRGPHEVADRIGTLDHILQADDVLSLGESQAGVLDVGGHTRGHIAFVFGGDGVAFVGDALFALGCGRLFEGTAAQAWESLSRLMALPDETLVYCAHEYTAANARFCATVEPDNPALLARIADITKLRAQGLPTVPTRIGVERATNPFVRADTQELRAALHLPDAPAAEVFAHIRARKDSFA